MGQALYLLCEETKQVVHVNESSSSWFAGAESSLVVGAFCQAHVGKPLSVIGEGWCEARDDDEERYDYTAWTEKNVEQQFALFAPDNERDLWLIRKELDEATRKAGTPR